jgi:hypothetical protein
VDLTLAYSNTYDQFKDVRARLERLRFANEEPDLVATVDKSPAEPGTSRAPVRYRLSPGGIAALLECFRSGMPKSRLASRYGISVTRLLRKHGVRRDAGA